SILRTMRSDTPAAAGDTTPAAVIHHNQALRALNAIGTALSSLTDRDTTLRLIYERLGEVLDNRNFYIAVYQPADHSLFFPVYTIEGEMRPAGGRPYGSGLTEYVME